MSHAAGPEGHDSSSVPEGGSNKGLTPCNLFDILPIEGTLGPGQTELVDFSFYSYPGVKSTASAVCTVEGGPAYEVCCIFYVLSSDVKRVVPCASIRGGMSFLARKCGPWTGWSCPH